MFQELDLGILGVEKKEKKTMGEDCGAEKTPAF